MQIDTTKPLEPGIYLGLDDDAYHADPALGSSDVRTLRLSPPDYWFNSHMNPTRKPDNGATPAKIAGTAMHRLVLEGEAAFSAFCMRRPDDPDGATSADKSAVTKAANAKALQTGKVCIHGDAYDRIVIAAAMIAKNPYLAGIFDGGLSEVSVFWDRAVGDPDEGVTVRCKARFDKLKPGGIGDLKSEVNMLKKDFARACLERIAYHRIDIQADHYLEGRAQMSRLLKADAVFGADDKAHAELAKIVGAAEKLTGKGQAFQLVFFQNDGAPITWSTVISAKNPILQTARAEREAALYRYVEFMKRFGSGMWVLEEPPTELDLSDLPTAYQYGRV